MSYALERLFFSKRLRRMWRSVSSAYLARPWSSKAYKRMAIYYSPNKISFAQVYPFVYYHADFQDRYGVEIRCIPFEMLEQGNLRSLKGADIILLQPWFTIEKSALQRVCETVKTHAPQAELSFIDAFAHNDLRLAPALPDDLRFYFKKSLYADYTNYEVPFRGNSMHNQFYSDLYGLDATDCDFENPAPVLPRLLPKLRLSPNFFTAQSLIDGFMADAPPTQDGRTLDVMTRLGATGPHRYAAIRRNQLAVLDKIKGVSVSAKDRISHSQYMQEMRSAKVCFSPFGYGELCWRDIEAILEGSVLIKQDMGHLQTLPNLYDPGETYLPVKWDLSDLEEVIHTALNDKGKRIAVTSEAYRRVAKYVQDRQFVADMGILFD